MKHKVLVVLALLAIALVCVLPFPQKINTTLPGIRWEHENYDYSENIDLTVRGTFYQYLFRDNVFKGELDISGLERVENSPLMDITLRDDHKTHFKTGSLTYLMYYRDKENGFSPAGTITVKGAFKEIVICIAENAGENGRFITAPAANREEAIDLTEDIMGDLWKFE